VLVAADGTRLAEDHNRVVATGDRTQHPEVALARWAATHLSTQDRAGATVFTSYEHCAVCAAAHGWVGLGRIVYAHSSAKLADWLADMAVPSPPVRSLAAVHEVVPGIVAQGPVPELAMQVRELHRRFHQAT
jgi:tRNA(Arg) A34 adenosine deaminase TadA